MSVYFKIWLIAAAMGTFLIAGIATVKAEEFNQPAMARGVVNAPDRVDITTDIVAPIATLGVRAGSSFKKGDVLVDFDCGRYEAELRAAKASANATWVELKQKRFLFNNGATGRSEVELASANSARASAEIDAIDERMRACTIKAPFDGRVVQANARVAEMPQGGEPLMTIIDDASVEIELVVPSRWLRHMGQGTRFEFTIDETGRSYDAEIVRLGAEVDPVSQTIQIYSQIIGDQSLVLAGMSGDAKFDFLQTSSTQAGEVR